MLTESQVARWETRDLSNGGDKRNSSRTWERAKGGAAGFFSFYYMSLPTVPVGGDTCNSADSVGSLPMPCDPERPNQP